MEIIWYNVIIISLIVLIGIFSIMIGLTDPYDEVFLAVIAIIVTTVLFVMSIKLDKLSTIRMLVLLDDNKRKILTALDQERTFQELNTLSDIGNYRTRLQENIDQMKEIGLINERFEFVIENGRNRWVKKFTRSF